MAEEDASAEEATTEEIAIAAPVNLVSEIEPTTVAEEATVVVEIGAVMEVPSPTLPRRRRRVKRFKRLSQLMNPSGMLEMASEPSEPASYFGDVTIVLEEEEAVPKAKPPMWPLENVPPYFQSSGNPCLDFFNMVEYTPPEMVRELLPRAWAHNPLTTLKLILHRRRPALCFDKEVFYTLVFWLHQNHPKTLTLNLRWFAQVGYTDHLLDILFHEAARPDILKIEKEESEFLYRIEIEWKRILAEKERLRPELARMAVERYNSDSNYRFMYDKISDFLVKSLEIDIWFLRFGRVLEDWARGSVVPVSRFIVGILHSAVREHC
ncbi:hypothetical protein CKAN_00750400 [Cinnamomum micranthum f. kanehirae]|uniref:DUF2828 domain-containing protein n=1 Tax=Cinnamomum micranthum f. kanehirae TaxID=337451 RepID=A0A3S3P0Q2_9MAGN|nr:hypothetical protein CKAN_00750400 [Cinnamomum micranthum f. kanehirae]